MIALALDHVWQSTLFVAGAAIVALLLKANSAAMRYHIWFVASLKFFFPLALLTGLGKALSPALPVLPAAPPIALGMAGAAQPFSDGLSLSIPAAASWNWEPVLAALWLAGFLIIVANWARQWRQLRQLVRRAVRIDMNAPLEVRTSSSQMEPAIVGILSPVLILPAGIAQQLSVAELEAILAHEICHWRRRDNLTAILHMAVEAIFWFHPIVWWLETRLVAERERACDEAVIAAGRDRQVYAEGILKVCKSHVQSRLQCAAGVSGADLKRRIEAIMDGRLAVRLGAIKRGLLAACAAIAVVTPFVVGLLTAPPVLAGAADVPHPGTEAALRRLIDGLEAGRVEYAMMIPALAQAERAESESLLASIRKGGAVKSITFRGNKNGNDVYLVALANQAIISTIGPLSPDGKIAAPLFFWPAIVRDTNGPSPGLQATLRRQLEGAIAGRPGYEEMPPAQRATSGRPWVIVHDMAQTLGPVRALAFQGVDARGRDIYQVTFANGTATIEAAPLLGGKLSDVLATDFLVPNAAPHKEREPLLRRFIEGDQKQSYPSDVMSPALIAAVQQQQGKLRSDYAKMGTLQSMTFLGGGYNGVDVYRVVCAHATFEYRVGPLTPDGKLDGIRRRILT